MRVCVDAAKRVPGEAGPCPPNAYTLPRLYACTRRPAAFSLFPPPPSAIMSLLSLMSILDEAMTQWFEAEDAGIASDCMAVEW
jgi:hypothetical protein